MGARVNLTKIITMRDTKANVEANSATMEEVNFSYTTNTEELGIYSNGSWVWIGSGPTAELLVDEDGNILLDEDNDVLYEG